MPLTMEKKNVQMQENADEATSEDTDDKPQTCPHSLESNQKEEVSRLPGNKITLVPFLFSNEVLAIVYIKM